MISRLKLTKNERRRSSRNEIAVEKAPVQHGDTRLEINQLVLNRAAHLVDFEELFFDNVFHGTPSLRCKALTSSGRTSELYQSQPNQRIATAFKIGTRKNKTAHLAGLQICQKARPCSPQPSGEWCCRCSAVKSSSRARRWQVFRPAQGACSR